MSVKELGVIKINGITGTHATLKKIIINNKSKHGENKTNLSKIFESQKS